MSANRSVKCESLNDGVCLKGYYGGRPSVGTCIEVCKEGTVVYVEITHRPPPAAKKYDGSKLWPLIHTARDKAELLSQLGQLPCGQCKAKTAAYLKANPIPDDASPEWIARWSWEFHNFVNASLIPPKPRFEWSDFLTMYPQSALKSVDAMA